MRRQWTYEQIPLDEQQQPEQRQQPVQHQQGESSAKKPRLGGASVGEGAWSLAPLGPSLACTFFVPFLAKELGTGVWQAMVDTAENDGVTMKLRGNNSSGRHDAAQDYRSLTIYGVSASAVEHHVGQIFDAAVAANVDFRNMQVPEQWMHILSRGLP
jgi:hypothetical protein